MATKPVVGDSYTYSPSHGHGYGHNAKGDVLSAEMTELDLMPGTVITVHDINAEDGDRVHAEWVDAKELDRITAIDAAEFAADFKKA